MEMQRVLMTSTSF